MKQHPLYEGYSVTTDGRVYSHYRKQSAGTNGIQSVIDYNTEPRELTTRLHPAGYVYITLGQHGAQRVHRLVAQTYIENPHNLAEVNHIDEDKTNNNVGNLEWCDRQRNAEHSLSKHYVVEEIATGHTFDVYNLSAFCRERNLSVGSLCETLLQQRRKQHKGYRCITRVT